MARKRKTGSREHLLESKLSELVAGIKDLCPDARIEVSFEQYEDEDAHVCVYPSVIIESEGIERLELAVGERCNDILLETGLFIVSAVCE
jgi:hypothetical protein